MKEQNMGTDKTEVLEQGNNVLKMSEEEYFCKYVIDDINA